MQCPQHASSDRRWSDSPDPMTVQLWERPHLSSGSVLGNEAHEGKHGQAAVLQLLQLVLLKRLHREGCNHTCTYQMMCPYFRWHDTGQSVPHKINQRYCVKWTSCTFDWLMAGDGFLMMQQGLYIRWSPWTGQVGQKHRLGTCASLRLARLASVPRLRQWPQTPAMLR